MERTQDTHEGLGMKTTDLHLEIVEKLEKKANAKLANDDRVYHKVNGFKSYGIRAPAFGELFKPYRTVLKQLSFREKLELARMFFKSGFIEQEVFGIAVLSYALGEMRPENFDFLDEIAGYINNWGATDYFSLSVLQPLLRAYPKETMRLLRRWNKSETLWKRRASAVVFTRRIGSSGEFTDEALELCDNLVWDKEDLVRKDVGWALKDVMRGNKKRVLEYVKGLRQKGVSAVITLYAIRDLKGNERKKILQIKPDIKRF
jgi:3-methyladenine DNA glycosylase AlkD